MLLVGAVLVALASVLWPNLAAWTEASRLPRAADTLRGELVSLRVRAMEEGTEQIFSYQPGTPNYRIAALGDEAEADGSEPEELERGIRFGGPSNTEQAMALGGRFQVSAADAQGSSWTAIEFHPDGTTTDAQIELVDEAGIAVTFRIRGLTGTIQVSKPAGAAATGVTRGTAP